MVGAEAEGPSMYDLTIDDFPPDRLTAIVHWRNDPVVNRYLRQGIRTFEEVQEWYVQYFSRAENKSVTSGKAGGLKKVEPLKADRSCEPLKAVRLLAAYRRHLSPQVHLVQAAIFRLLCPDVLSDHRLIPPNG